MMNLSPQPNVKVITGLSDFMKVNSNLKKPKVSPARNGSTNNVSGKDNSAVRTNSPNKGSVSPKNNNGGMRRGDSRDASHGRTVAPTTMQPFSNENSQGGGMNSLLKSPIKNNLHQVPVKMHGGSMGS